jgi:hypothetical protein
LALDGGGLMADYGLIDCRGKNLITNLATSTGNGQPVVHQQIEQANLMLAGITDLRSKAAPSDLNKVYSLAFRLAVGDCAMPSYRWSATSTGADNGGTIIRPNSVLQANPGRWLAIVTGSYKAEWFGCKGDNVSDNAVGFQAAIDACIADGIGTLEFGAGQFYYTVSPVIPAGSQLSIVGQGSNKTIFYPVNQHGLTISNNNSEGIVSRITGIHIQCSGQNYCGIYAPGTELSIGDGTRLYGYQINDCTVTNAGVGIYIGYGSQIIVEANEIINCYYGIVFRGQCIGCVARKNHLLLATSPGAPPVGLVPVLDPGGGSQAIWVGGRTYTAGYLRSEDVQIRENWSFGYQIGCTIYDCLYSIAEGNDFDYCKVLGIFFNSTDGGTRILNNWIGMDARTTAVTAGISSNTAGAVNTNLATVRDNHIAVVGSTQGGVGIRILYNAYEGTIVKGNTIDCSAFQYGIFFDRVNDGQIIGNRLYGTLQPGDDYIVASQCSRLKVFDNQTPDRFPFYGNCTQTIGRYYISILGILHQDGTHFKYFNGTTYLERIGANDGDIVTTPASYTAIGGGAGIDLASPPPIGATTPNTGTFTFVSGSRQLVSPIVPDGTTLVRSQHIGRKIMIDGGTITFPADANWQSGDELEVVVVGTNTTTFSGNGLNFVSASITTPVGSVQIPGVVGNVCIFQKMPGPIIYVFSEAPTVATLNDLTDVVNTSPRRDDTIIYTGAGYANLSAPMSVNDRWERAFYSPGAGTTITTYGITLTTTGSTIATPQVANTSVYNKANRFTLQSAATAGAIATFRCGNQKLYRGANANEGGFRIIMPFGLAQMQVGQRGIVSISNAGAPTNVDPLTSTASSKIGVAFAANTGNWTLIYNNAGTAPTQVALGANFPIDITTWYELRIECVPGGTSFLVEVINKTTGQTSGVLTLSGANIPLANNYLFPNCWMTNNATAAAVTFALGTGRMEYGA